MNKVKIATSSIELLRQSVSSNEVSFCSGLFLSARWFVLSDIATKGFHLVVLPTSESAEYCSSDLYNLVEGDKIFFLPDSGKNIARSNYKSSLNVQRTSAIGRILERKEDDFSIIVTYPEALEEGVPAAGKITDSILNLSVGQEISHDQIKENLAEKGFEKVDFVAIPGQYAIRGSIVRCIFLFL